MSTSTSTLDAYVHTCIRAYVDLCARMPASLNTHLEILTRSSTHQVYQAYADYQDMMVLTEDLLAHVARRVLGSTSVHISGAGGSGGGGGAGGAGPGVTLDFGTAFKRLDYMEAIQTAAGTSACHLI